MGRRGKLPAVQSAKDEPLDDLTPPPWLSPAAAHWYAQHAPGRVALGLLTQGTADSFAMLADLRVRWEDMREGPITRSYLDARKSLISDLKCWRMLPTEKPVVPAERHDDKGEFTFN